LPNSLCSGAGRKKKREGSGAGGKHGNFSLFRVARGEKKKRKSGRCKSGLRHKPKRVLEKKGERRGESARVLTFN